MMKKYETVKEYMRDLPKDKREALDRVRSAALAAAPTATDCISYDMPALRYNSKVLFCYAAFKNHWSIFPGIAVIEQFSEELADFKTSKGTIQFTSHKQLPINLIKKIAKSRMKAIDTKKK